MKRLTLYTAVALFALSPTAQAQESEWPELQEFLERFSEESQEFLEGWAEDLAPLLEGLRDKMDDLSLYEAPEVLPNGDIIIRRKPDRPDDEPEMSPEGTIDL
jgi:hypothetical protein